MGSYASLVRQSAILLAFTLVVVGIAPAGAKLWCAVVGTGALVFFIAVSILRHRQIGRLSTQIDTVLQSGRQLTFDKCREGDVAVLANELEKMVARLARTTDQLARERSALADSLADISHQIRTPLTAAELMVPQIQHADDASSRKRALRELEALLDRVAWLVTALLKIAKVDAGSITVRQDQVSAAAAIGRGASPLAAAFDLHDVTLAIDVQDGATFQGDEMWTAEAIENILKNCMEHTPAGGTVSVVAAENALACTIVIADTGPGIAPEDLPHLFERFYRGAQDAERDAGPTPNGFGIGLALAQALVSAQKGTLRASNAPDGGATFQITFPKLVV